MFGTSGIRGIAGKGITCELMLSLGRVVGAAGRQIALSRDTRNTSKMLSAAFASGAAEAGASVIDIGVAPTPTLAFATKRLACTGAMITASHNPPEYNGIKLFENGMEISRGREAEIEKKLSQGTLLQFFWGKAGAISENSAIVEKYCSLLLSLLDAAAIAKRKPSIAIDCANGAGGEILPKLLTSLGCNVFSLNCAPLLPPNATPEPKAENLDGLSRLIKTKRADFGIALDPDADRAVILDGEGKLLGQDEQLALMCRYILSGKKGRIITTVEASLLVREAVEKAGGRLLITPVGSMHVAQKLVKEKALFGGEPCGEYVFSDSIPAADGVLTSLKFTELFCIAPALFFSCGKMKKYPMVREKYACADKEEAMKKIKKGVSSLGINGKTDTQDGVRVDFEGGWLLLRPSGTEPAMRLTLECKKEKKLKEIHSLAARLIKDSV